MNLLPADEDQRLRTLMDWSRLAETPEDVNPYYLGEMVVTLISELVVAWGQTDLLRGFELSVGGADGPS